MKKITIAIDGHSSTGKSTLAKDLAKRLGYAYIDTGAMYRAVTLYAIGQHWIDELHFDQAQLIENLTNIEIHFEFNKALGFAEVYLNGKNVEKEIRSLNVSHFVSQVSTLRPVREKLVSLQQQLGKEKGVVMDGRDIGTVVFPDAELKLFMTASTETRALRRYNELINKGQNVTYNEILQNVQKRDRIDSTRKESPLFKAADAIELDNSNLSRTEQFERVLKIVEEKIESLS